MNKQEIILHQLKQQKLLPLFYHENETVCIEVVKALYNAGIRIVEITNRGEHALHNMKVLIAARDKTMPDLLLAAGTVRTVYQAGDFLDTGADFSRKYGNSISIWAEWACNFCRIFSKIV